MTGTAPRMVVEFAAPGARLNLNGRVHWSTRHRLTKQWRNVAAYNAIAQLGRTPAERRRDPSFVRVSFPVAERYVNTRRDPHNWTLTVKAIVDGLVDAGVWPDDHDGFVTVLDSRFHPITANPAVVVTIYPRAGGYPG